MPDTKIPSDPVQFVKDCIQAGRLRWTHHVTMRLSQRGLTAAALLDSVASMEVIESYPDDKYLPSYLIRAESQRRVFHVLVAVDTAADNVRIVTMYTPDPFEWTGGLRVRRSLKS